MGVSVPSLHRESTDSLICACKRKCGGELASFDCITKTLGNGDIFSKLVCFLHCGEKERSLFSQVLYILPSCGIILIGLFYVGVG